MRSTRLILGCMVALVLLSGVRQESLSGKCFVRAVLLQAKAQRVQVGLLYQDVAASADTSEAGETLKIAVAEEDSLENAFAAAERHLPQKADYKLCDYLLLCGEPEYALLEEYETLLLEQTEQGRLAAYVYSTDGDLSFFEQSAQEEKRFLSEWLDTLRLRRENSFRLYEISKGRTLLPLLSVKESDTPYWHSGAWLTSKDGSAQKLDENSAQLLFLLRNCGGEQRFVLQGEKIEVVPWAIEKYSASSGKVVVMLWAKLRYGGNTTLVATQLETMAENLFEVYGEELEMLLGFRGIRAMAGTSEHGGREMRFWLYDMSA